ncbi:Anaphase-promoting complex subunit 1 [Malassezia sp. CBS 17886]|nr:Anaphase-promoting complex subunit 1 [Malassezia sp. CBS 17886]
MEADIARVVQESTQLTRLRAMVRARTAADAAGGRFDTGDGELSWSVDTVVWRSRGARLRTFQYDEPVRAACMARLTRGGGRAERAICVLLARTAAFYFPRSGEEHILPLFFRVTAVFPLCMGLLIQRAPEPEDAASGRGDAHTPPLPLAFYLRDVFDDMVAWTRAASITRRVPTPQPPAAAAVLQAPLQRFPQIDECVMYASGLRDAAPTLLVTASPRTRSLRVYEYVCAADALEHACAGLPRAASDATSDVPLRARKSRRSSAAQPPLLTRRASARLSTGDAGAGRRRISQQTGGAEPLAAVLDSTGGRRHAHADRMPDDAGRRASALHAPPPTDSPAHAAVARFAHAHAAVSLLAEIAVPELRTADDAAHVHCFVLDDAAPALLYAVVPVSARAFCREIVRTHVAAGVALDARVPAHVRTPAVLSARDVRPVRVFARARCDGVVMLLEDGSLHLALGVPRADVPAVTLRRGVDAICPLSDTSVRAVHSPGAPRRGHGAATAAHVICTLLRPTCARTAWVLDALLDTLPAADSAALRHAWADARAAPRGDWDTLLHVLGMPRRAPLCAWDALLRDRRGRNRVADAVLGGADARAERRAAGATGGKAAAATRAEAASTAPCVSSTCTPLPLRSIAVTLHFLTQDACLDSLRRRSDAPALAEVVLWLCRRLGWVVWVDYWTRLFPAAGKGAGADGTDGAVGGAASPPGAHACHPPAPPHLYTHLHAALHGTAPPSLSDMHAAVCEAVGMESAPPVNACRTSVRVLEAYRVLSAVGRDAGAAEGRGAGVCAPSTPRAPAPSQTTVQHLLHAGWDADALARLPAGVALPLLEAVRSCTLDPPVGWTPAAYALLGRMDAAAQAAADGGAPQTPGRVNAALQRTLPRDAALDPLSAMLFSKDFRLGDVVRLLQTVAPNVAHIREDGGDEEERAARTAACARAYAARTMAQCVGRGMFHMASRALRKTGTWRTPPLCLALRTLPDGALVDPYAGEPHETEWPEFHNGVASALEIAVHVEWRIDSNWIFAHQARDGGARHAGFLLGLGLNGHLARLGRVHAYRYLAPRHALTTVGLVLGLGASFLGTADPAARQVMAVQVAAFLPHGSAPLHFSPLTQAAGLLGMGLVFCGTDHRWTAERLLAQVSARDLDAAGSAAGAPLDVYAQCAGLALGLVFLGRARRTPMDSPSDAALLATLRRLLSGTGVREPAAAQRAVVPAILALALVFLRSNRTDIAALLAPPTAVHELPHVRPDLLLPRALARALILWDDIAPEPAWLARAGGGACAGGRPTRVGAPGAPPEPPSAAAAPPSSPPPPPLGARLAWYNTRAGACLALSLKYAGSADARARSVLLAELARLPAGGARATYEEQIEHAAQETLRDVLHLALATVMAGSGDVDLLRILRAAHADVGSPAETRGAPSHTRSYGSHMATHMALGLLFLGGGRFTLGTSDVAVAALLLALLPRFPDSPADGRAHLQAARHMWVLALEPRLVVARDVSSGEHGLLPATVHSASRRYWPAALNLAYTAHEPRQIHWLHVQRRTGYLSYLDDPHGHRSIFSHARYWTRYHFSPSAQIEADDMLHDLLELVRSFETAPHYAVLVRRVCRGRGGGEERAWSAAAPRSAFQMFCTSVLIESLTRDAPLLTHFYLGLWDALQRGADAPDACLFIDDVAMLDGFYGTRTDALLRGARDQLLADALLDGVRVHMRVDGADARGAHVPTRVLRAMRRYLAGADAHRAPPAAAAPRPALLAAVAAEGLDDCMAPAVALQLAVLRAPLHAATTALRTRFERAPSRALGGLHLRRALARCRRDDDATREALAEAMLQSWM